MSYLFCEIGSQLLAEVIWLLSAFTHSAITLIATSLWKASITHSHHSMIQQIDLYICCSYLPHPAFM